ncbi:MAG: zinc ribbon domain-containing protein [bacterium]
MPTYEYECSSCGYLFEKFQVISAPALKRCPKCRHKVRRLVGTGAGLIFKGSGFYSTDYRSDSYKTAQRAEKTSTASESSKSTTKTKTGTDSQHSVSGKK